MHEFLFLYALVSPKPIDMYQTDMVAKNNNDKGLHLQEGGRSGSTESDINSDYPNVYDNVNTMETDEDFNKEMIFVDDGEFLLHGKKRRKRTETVQTWTESCC